MLKDFKQFILRGNVIDLAVGVVIGSAFSTVVNAMVKDLLTPFIGAIIKIPTFSNLSLTVRGSNFMFGDLLNASISFLLIAICVFFFVVTPMNALVKRMRKEPPADPTTKKCPECKSQIPINARRCAYCTQVIMPPASSSSPGSPSTPQATSPRS